ncbi:hypothetical protein C7974DRAFT_415559 [Boeremia exigua]|uniref:uncharacterized protein n=1 Tax=Boeremia exigua TaxID=749465 RepID=UPI001E8CC9B8|nr:uncharacterized protein C7974DRAFT_415559 [Boeremia exigua]KAH6620349.1 hypothetical protein C7974DRAFT_415559 [Boeremia exigua]
MAPLTPAQLLGLTVASRLTSLLSLLGSVFIAATYMCSAAFRTPKTRLIFYATAGNVLTNAATIVSVAALPEQGREAGGWCRAQAAVVQWGLCADFCWVFCMALNVWFIFMRRRDSGRDLRRLDKWYALGSYGLPALPAVAYLVHDTCRAGEDIIGDAIIWCWVRPEYDWMRIAFFYAPMWILAVATTTIHVRVGIKIYKVKMELRQVLQKSRANLEATPGSVWPDVRPSGRHITATSDIAYAPTAATPSTSTNSLTPLFPSTQTSDAPTPASRPPSRLRPLAALHPRSARRHATRLPTTRCRATAYATPLVPSTFSSPPSQAILSPGEHAAFSQHRSDTADTYAYFKVSFLLFIALIVVWGPSSINRLVSIIPPHRTVYGLNLASALVLPMQGLWNALIYAQATWGEVKKVYARAMLWVGRVVFRTPVVQPERPVWAAQPIRPVARQARKREERERESESGGSEAIELAEFFRQERASVDSVLSV